MTSLQNQFLREKSFENYSDSSVLETMLTAADVHGDIPAMINNLYDACLIWTVLFGKRGSQQVLLSGMCSAHMQ